MSGLAWGILGTGHIAHSMARDLVGHGFRVAAVGSRDRSRADAFAAEFSIPKSYGSYEALVDSPAVDVVYVATPHPTHAATALLALNAGKHALVEKPFTLNAAQAGEVVSLAATRGLVVQEAMWTRFLPHMGRVRDIIDAGVVGTIRALIADHAQILPADPHSRFHDPVLGGGALLDLGVYLVSFAHELFGLPRAIDASASLTTTGVDGRIAITTGYDQGRYAQLYAALDCRGSNRASIIGSRGRIEIDPVWFAPTGFTVYDDGDGLVERVEDTASPNGMQYQCRYLEDLIVTGRPRRTILPAAESVAIMGTLDAIRTKVGLRYPGEC